MIKQKVNDEVNDNSNESRLEECTSIVLRYFPANTILHVHTMLHVVVISYSTI